jgi:hypothetical protein
MESQIADEFVGAEIVCPAFRAKRAFDRALLNRIFMNRIQFCRWGADNDT